MRPGSELRRAVAAPALGHLLSSGDCLVDVGGYDGSVVAGVGRDGVWRVTVDVDGEGLRKSASSSLPVAASAFDLPFAVGAADVVCCFDVLPSLRGGDPYKLYAELRRVLRRDGHLLLTEIDDDFSLPFMSQQEAFRQWGAMRTRPASENHQALTAAGFRVIDQRRYYGLVARTVYLLFFMWNRPRRGHRLKCSVWRAVAHLDRLLPLGARATLVVASAAVGREADSLAASRSTDG